MFVIVDLNTWCDVLGELKGGYFSEPDTDSMVYNWRGWIVGAATGYLASQYADGRDRVYQIDRELIAQLSDKESV